jgi:hypothetical protein
MMESSLKRRGAVALIVAAGVWAGAIGVRGEVGSNSSGGKANTVAQATDAKKAATAVSNAVTNLLAEVNAHKKDPKTALRAKSNYFIENKDPDATPEEILNALNRSHASDVYSDTYIKWQLLSGIDSKVDPKIVSKLLTAYRAAPLPNVRPALEASERRRLDSLLLKATPDDLNKINSELQKEVEANNAANVPILTYREDLYAHLPGSGDAILAGLEDGAARAGRGIDADKHMKGVMAQITTWSVGATPSEIHAVASLLRGMAAKMVPGAHAANGAPGQTLFADIVDAPVILAKGKGGGGGAAAQPRPVFPPNYYISAEMDPKTKHAAWKEGAAKFPDVKAISAMVQQLDQTAATLATIKK